MSLLPVLQYNNAAYLFDQLSYDGVSSSFLLESKFAFKADGTRVFWQQNRDVAFRDLSSAWDISSQSQDDGKFEDVLSAFPETPDEAGVDFSPDGTKLYVGETNGSGEDIIRQYAISPAWGGSLGGSPTVTLVATDTTAPTAYLRTFHVAGSGTRIVAMSRDGKFYEATLSTAYDLSTIGTWSTIKLDLSGTYTEVESFCFGRNERQMLILESSPNKRVHEYLMTTTLDVSTAVLNDTFDPTPQTGAIEVSDVTFGKSGQKMYVMTNTAYQYSAVR